MSKMYNTSKGVKIDVDAFLAKNETVRAVGNMNVNARGDLLDSTNEAIQAKNKQVAAQYRKQIGNMVVDQPIYASKRAEKRAKDIAGQYSAPVPNRIDGLDIPIENKVAPEVAEPEAKVNEEALNEAPKTGGLAGAIAKARESKQEPLKTERQQIREAKGVKRI